MKKRLSIIIPVLNEERRINQTLNQLAAHVDYERAEIIVVDGSPNQSTLKAIRMSRVIKTSSSKGRGLQMNRGALLATADTLLFLHADTVLPENFFKDVLHAVSKENMAGGAFDLAIDSERPLLSFIARVASVRSRLTRLPYGDQGIFIKARLFKKVGGFKNMTVMEDVEFMRRIKRSGLKIKILKKKIKTSSRRWDKEGVLYCTLRNWVILVLFFLGVPHERLGKVYKP